MQTLKVPVMHQPEVLHWVQDPPLAPLNPGRHTQSVTWVDLRGLYEFAGHARHEETSGAPSVGW